MVEPLRPIEKVKYLIIILGVVASFTNLFDCIVSASPIEDYFLYVGVIFVGTILLSVIPNNTFLCGILALFGLIAIIENPIITVSWGVVLLIFSKRIADNFVYSILIYIVTGLAVTAKLIFESVTPSDAINIIVAYPIVYFIDYLLYTKVRGET